MASGQLERLNAALAGRYSIQRELGRGGMEPSGRDVSRNAQSANAANEGGIPVRGLADRSSDHCTCSPRHAIVIAKAQRPQRQFASFAS